jgi:hypothetical protein
MEMDPENRIASTVQDIARRGIPAKHPTGNSEPAVACCSAFESMIAPVLPCSAHQPSYPPFIQESACVHSWLRPAESVSHDRAECRINRSSGSQAASVIICKSPPHSKNTRIMPVPAAPCARSPQRSSGLADACEYPESNGQSMHPEKCSREQRLLYGEVTSETGVNVNE